ncbi:MAG: hypothetical protein U1F43_10670 [Myxococcota bacterium]
MKRILSGPTLALALALASPSALAAPSPSGPTPDQVRTLLSGYEKVPSADDWARLGPPEAVSAELVRIASGARADAHALLAARATSSLAHFPLPSVRAFLEARVRDTSARPQLRGKAAIALARAFGDAAAPAIASLFAAGDADLREDAIRAYRQLVSPAAERFVLARAAREPLPRLAGLMREAGQAIASERQQRKNDRRLDPTLESTPDIADPGPVAR